MFAASLAAYFAAMPPPAAETSGAAALAQQEKAIEDAESGVIWGGELSSDRLDVGAEVMKVAFLAVTTLRFAIGGWAIYRDSFILVESVLTRATARRVSDVAYGKSADLCGLQCCEAEPHPPNHPPS